MPQKKTRSRKSPARKGRKSGGIRGFDPLACTVFPSFMTGKVTYATNAVFAVPAYLIAANVYRLNSIFDPDYSGTGTSVLGYAQLNALYGKYRVLSADVILDVFPSNAVANSNAKSEVMIVASNDLTLGVNADTWLGQRFVATRPLFGGNGAKIRLHVPIHTVYGVPKRAVQTEDDFASVMTSNPSNPVLLHVGMRNFDGVGTSLSYALRIVYHIRAELPKALA
jgi:hypothetical protein